MYLDKALGEFSVRINRIAIETNGEDVLIVWNGVSYNFRDAFEGITNEFEASGHIFKSSTNRYGNFILLPYERNDDFYINHCLKENMVSIECYEKKSITVDSVVTDEKFNFLIDIISKFEIKEKTIFKEDSVIWLKARLILSDEAVSNSNLIAPTKTTFINNPNLTGVENKYFEFGASVDLSFVRTQKW